MAAYQISGELIPPPSWYPLYLPKFYRQTDGSIRLRPLHTDGDKTSYSHNDELDIMLYWQMIVGQNRIDVENAKSVYWIAKDGNTGLFWVRAALKADLHGDGGGNFADIKNVVGYDEQLKKELQVRYVENEKTTRPYLAKLNAVADGIELLTIPMSTDKEFKRPEFYPDYLPSLVMSTGQPFQLPNGTVQVKPKIANFKPTPEDIAALMLWLQPIVAYGKTPYPVNWFIAPEACGAIFLRYCLTTNVLDDGLSADQYNVPRFPYIFYARSGNLMELPPQPKAPSGWLNTISNIAAGIVKVIPVIGQIGKVTQSLASSINDGNALPPSTLAANVQQAANGMVQQQQAAAQTKKYTSWALYAVFAIVIIFAVIYFAKHKK